jgi:DNA repair protein RecO
MPLSMPSSRILSALVFSRKNIGEADRFVTFFTREEGLIRAIAKGVRKIPSSRGGHLEPCTLVSATLYESKSRMSGEQGAVYAGKVETQEYFQLLHEDSDAFARACAHVQLFQKLFDSGQAVPELFDAFVTAWMQYPTFSEEKRTAYDAALVLQIIQHAGLMPDTRDWSVRNRDPIFAVIKYLAENPTHASRIALSSSHVAALQRGMGEVLRQALQEMSVV